MRKKILIFIACVLAVIGVICSVYYPESNINNTISETQNIIQNEIKKEEKEVIVSEYVKGEANDTIQVTVEENKEVETTEILNSSFEEEKTLENQLESDAEIEQENISYDGINTGNGLSLLGAYQGLTYYSQADSRWANIPYTSTGNSTQTMKSSACGPTSAAMVVSSSKGAILPTALAQLAVSNGYRTANNGTAWSYYSFIADYFNFNEFYTTSSFSVATNYLKQDKNNDGVSDYFVIVACGSGLFTTSGHYIVLAGETNNTIKVYDPYLYSGKFSTASRRNASVVLNGNTAYVSEASFIKYGNAKGYWIYSNDMGSKNPNNKKKTSYKQGERVLVNDPIAVAYDGGASEILVDNGQVQYWINRSVVKNNYVYGLATIVWDEEKRVLVQIFETQFWVNPNTITTEIPNSTTTNTTNNTSTNSNKYSTGNYITTSNVNVRSGPSTNYKIKKVYKKGTVFTVKSIHNGEWGLTPSGYVNLKYAKKR